MEISKSDEKSRKNKVLRMGPPGGQNVPTPRGSILTLSRGSQLPYTSFFLLFVYQIFYYWTPHSYQQMLGSMYYYASFIPIVQLTPIFFITIGVGTAPLGQITLVNHN